MINIHDDNSDKMCPILHSTCQKEQCAWFVSKDVPKQVTACAVQLLGNGMNVVASLYTEGIAI
ncbi:hypothetical protein [Mahella australiensis]|uniref:Uncharacterized protein n=1 Tax=Mahella australiensis (strain DSM 15567 / CIP 107919 / 50-1 BON) TaxID=697281 RepID=F3ZVG4_MAHA5|nr:hypothetical protein [Mahella australiensis]AEE95314.1 hypothetical protein Mahau_0091 [Mahella australiensis 50-1 BON]